MNAISSTPAGRARLTSRGQAPSIAQVFSSPEPSRSVFTPLTAPCRSMIRSAAYALRPDPRVKLQAPGPHAK